MSTAGQKLSPARRKSAGRGGRRADKAEIVIAALLSGHRLIDVAAELNMGYRTLKDWMAADWFRSEYNAVKKQLLDGTINKLRSAGNDSVDLLHAVVLNRKLATTPRVRAARGLLELLLRAVETQDLSDRLDKLEGIMSKQMGERR